MEELKAAVIGVGAMGQNHARVYADLPQTRLVGVADSSEEYVRRVAAKYGVAGYTDYHDLLARVMPDVVTVAVPTSRHKEVAATAFRRFTSFMPSCPLKLVT